MKGISTIVATILMLLIVISLAGTVYVFFSGILTGKTAKMIELLHARDNIVLIRNSGTENISSGEIRVIVDGQEATIVNPQRIEPQESVVLKFLPPELDMNTTNVVVFGPSNSISYTTEIKPSPFKVNEGTVGLWHFDEGTGNTASDSSGNENDGTLNGGIGTNKFSNPSFETDNNGDGLADSWSVYGGSYTYSLVDDGIVGKAQKMDITSTSGGIYQGVSFEQNQYHTFSIWLKVEMGEVICQDLNRHHLNPIIVSVAENGNQWKKYTASGYVDTDPDCCVHCYAHGQASIFYLDEARLETGWTDGKFGECLSFDGNNDYVLIPNDPSIYLDGKDFTILAWIKPEPQGKYMFIYHKWRPNIYLNKNNVSWSFELQDTEGSKSVGITESIDGTKWYLVAQTVKQNQEHKAYIFLPDGTIKTNQRIITSSTGSDGSNFQLSRQGWHAADNAYYKGKIDEVKILNRSLTQEEILDEIYG